MKEAVHKHAGATLKETKRMRKRGQCQRNSFRMSWLSKAKSMVRRVYKSGDIIQMGSDDIHACLGWVMSRVMSRVTCVCVCGWCVATKSTVERLQKPGCSDSRNLESKLIGSSFGREM